MSNIVFPRTTIDGVSLSRMIIGTNWILGYSHTTSAADKTILHFNHNKEAITKTFEVYLNAGVDTIMGPFGGNMLGENHPIYGAIKDAEDNTGRGMIIVDTPRINISDNKAARKETEKILDHSKKIGTTFCLPHHSVVDQLVNKETETIDRLPDYLSMIRDRDMIPGLSAHMPELVVYSDKNEYDVQTYIQIFNSAGFMMQIEVEQIHDIIWEAKKPVMTIKSMAAGRLSPFVGLTFSWSCIRDTDMVTVGCMTPLEAEEDIEISLAAIQRRRPFTKGRNSPYKTSILK